MVRYAKLKPWERIFRRVTRLRYPLAIPSLFVSFLVPVHMVEVSVWERNCVAGNLLVWRLRMPPYGLLVIMEVDASNKVSSSISGPILRKD